MHDETPITATFQPIIQIVGLKEIAKGPQVRYRVLLNDGVHSTSSEYTDYANMLYTNKTYIFKDAIILLRVY